MHTFGEKGQVLLIVVLIMVVALTIGLSVASRSITNLKIATDDESSQRAFSAAEAGVERLLQRNCTDTTNGCPLSDNISESNYSTHFDVVSHPLQGGNFYIKNGLTIRQDEGADVWLSTYSSDFSKLYTNPLSGHITVYWAENGGNCASAVSAPAALEIVVFTGNKTNPTVRRYAVDPCRGSTQRNSNFSAPDTTGATQLGSKRFFYTYSFDVTNGLLMRVIPLYANTTVGMGCSGVAASNCFPYPLQGQTIESTGTSGGTARKITFVQSFASVPTEFFQYSLMSP